MTLMSHADEVLEIDGETVVRVGQQVILLSAVAGALVVLLEVRGPLPAEVVQTALVEQFGEPDHPDLFDSTVVQLSSHGLIGLVGA